MKLTENLAYAALDAANVDMDATTRRLTAGFHRVGESCCWLKEASSILDDLQDALNAAEYKPAWSQYFHNSTARYNDLVDRCEGLI